MNAILSEDMIEATRLTREGRLTEASALLQRLVRGADGAGVTAAAPPARGSAPAGRMPRTIDVDPATGEPSQAAPLPNAAAGQGPTMAGPAGAFLYRMRRSGAMPGVDGLRHGPMARGDEPLPGGARFIDVSFSSQAGARRYKLYIPSTHGGTAAPLIVMLHGCTQSPEDFAAGTRMNGLAEERGCLVAYPEQTQSANAQKCWNWFSPGDQKRDAGEPALIAGIARQVMRDHAVDPTRVYVAGLSAGGAAAAILGQTYPDLFTAVGVHSGLRCGAARDVASAFAAMRQGAPQPHHGRGATVDADRRVTPTIVFHADKDGTVHPRNGDQVIAQSAPAGELETAVERGQVPGGRAFTRTIHTDGAGRRILEQWLVHGGGHAWSGGSAAGSYTDPQGPDASREMLRFFLEHARSTGAG